MVIFGAKTKRQKLMKKITEMTLKGVERLLTTTTSVSGFSPAEFRMRKPQMTQNAVQACSGASLNPSVVASPETVAARLKHPKASIAQPAATVCSLVAEEASV